MYLIHGLVTNIATKNVIIQSRLSWYSLPTDHPPLPPPLLSDGYLLRLVGLL